MARTCLMLLLLFSAIGVRGQDVEGEQMGEGDTSKLYLKIEEVAQRNWFTTIIHDLFFKPVAFRGGRDDLLYRKLVTRPYADYEGRPVRKVRVVTIDPFGFDVYDTLAAPELGTERFGNAMHAKTTERTVRNLILFREGQPFDSLLVRESERLIRQELYIQEVFFYPQLAGVHGDSVDVLVRVLDSWSIIPDIGFSGTRFSYGLTENNLAGINHVLHGYHTYNHALDRHALDSYYLVRNIRQSYVNTRVGFNMNEQGDFRVNASVDRPFYSTVTRWAGGASVSYQQQTDTINLEGLPVLFARSRSLPQDYWLARAIQLVPGSTEDDRATNLVLSAGVSALTYIERPEGPLSELELYRDRALFLGGIGISTRKYLRDRYIFNYGFIEDVPVGRSYGVTVGYEVRSRPRSYIGAHYSWGHYYRWGYFSSELSYGNYFRDGSYEQGTAQARITYFTGLLQLGKWKFRQFVKPEITLGFARPAGDNITLNEGRGGIRGFNSAELAGTHRFMVTVQTQGYAPWELLGFRFGPYLTCSMGMLGNSTDGFSKSSPYWMLGLGFLVNNRYLVFDNFEISLAFYPFIPGTGENNGRNVIIGNPFRAFNLGFPDYGLGRPAAVGY